MNMRFLLLFGLVSSALTFSGCSACSPAAPGIGNNAATTGNSAVPSKPAVTPANDGRPVSKAVPQGPANPTVAMDGPDAGPIRILFNKGENSSTVSGSVVRGERVDYVAGASNGQTMTVKVTSPEDNAVFQLQHHKGTVMKGAAPGQDARTWTGKLALSGDYYIIVGGSRGNAEYKLTVTIK